MTAYRGFIFTLDAIFSLIVASAAISILLYINFATPSYQAQQNAAQSLMQEMLSTTVGQIAQGRSMAISAAGAAPVTPFGYANFLQSPAGYIRAVSPPQYTNSITVSFWIDPVNNSLWGNPGNYWENALSGSKGCGDSYYFYIEAGASPPGYSWSITNTAKTPYGTSGSGLVPGVWQNLIGVYNGSGLIIYRNGAQSGSAAAASGTIIYNGTTISGTTPTSAGGGCNPISGGMADVQIYSGAVGPAAANTLYHEGRAGAPLNGYGLLGWWPLNGNMNNYGGSANGQATYTTLVQSSYTPLWSYNASSNESVLGMLAGLYLNGQSAVAEMLLHRMYGTANTGIFINNEYAPVMNLSWFGGTSSYVQVNSTPSLDLGSKLTFSAWIYPYTLSGCGTQNCIILNKENSYEWSLSATGQLCWALNNTAPGWTWVCPPIYVSAGKWSYVALTYNGSVATEYLDGVNATPSAASGAVGSTGLAFRIGARGAPGAPNSLFEGDMADVQIYNASLNGTQIDDLYKEGAGGIPVTNSDLVGWWPLDGNANDYSGNGNSGISVAMQYTQEGPVPPGLAGAYSVSRASSPLSLDAGGVNKLYNVSVVMWR